MKQKELPLWIKGAILGSIVGGIISVIDIGIIYLFMQSVPGFVIAPLALLSLPAVLSSQTYYNANINSIFLQPGYNLMIVIIIGAITLVISYAALGAIIGLIKDKTKKY